MFPLLYPVFSLISLVTSIPSGCKEQEKHHRDEWSRISLSGKRKQKKKSNAVEPAGRKIKKKKKKEMMHPPTRRRTERVRRWGISKDDDGAGGGGYDGYLLRTIHAWPSTSVYILYLLLLLSSLLLIKRRDLDISLLSQRCLAAPHTLRWWLKELYLNQ